VSNIPLARQIVAGVQAEIATIAPSAATRLADALLQMTRRPLTKPRAARRSTRITPEKAEAIRAFERAFPGLSHQDIADRFQVNIGRVSEALAGER
jgi:hypothetical protein